MNIQPGIYQHYKGPRYQVLGSAQHSETQEWMVVYQALYGEFGIWVRPLSMFCEQVEVQGRKVARFALLEAQAGIVTWPSTGHNQQT